MPPSWRWWQYDRTALLCHNAKTHES